MSIVDEDSMQIGQLSSSIEAQSCHKMRVVDTRIVKPMKRETRSNLDRMDLAQLEHKYMFPMCGQKATVIKSQFKEEHSILDYISDDNQDKDNSESLGALTSMNDNMSIRMMDKGTKMGQAHEGWDDIEKLPLPSLSNLD